jgi:hypothetical protein
MLFSTSCVVWGRAVLWPLLLTLRSKLGNTGWPEITFLIGNNWKVCDCLPRKPKDALATRRQSFVLINDNASSKVFGCGQNVALPASS